METNNTSAMGDNLKFQFDISKQMLDYHLTDLENKEYLWQSESNGLHIHEQEGIWFADWPETESYDIGTPSIAWTMWHIIFWWEMVYDYSFGEGTLTKEDITVYANAESAKERIETLSNCWQDTLEEIFEEDLFSTTYTKWPFTDLPFHQLASWLNLELMKNATEIGYTRFHYGAIKNRTPD